MNSYNQIVEVFNKVIEKYKNGCEVNREKASKILNACDEIDTIFAEQYGELFKAGFDEDSMQFIIELISPELVFYDGRSNPFFKLIKKVDSFSFSKYGKDSVCVKLNIDGVIKVNGQQKKRKT